MPSDVTQVYIARQPIFDRELNVAFYELLHRSPPEDQGVRIVNPDAATSELLVNSLVEIGLERITGDQLVFVNLTREYLIGEWVLPLEPAQVGLELVSIEEPDSKLVAAVKALVGRGFKIALDDFIYQPQYDELLDLVTMVKLDALELGEEGLRDQLALLQRFRVNVLAKRVEEDTQFKSLRDMGVHYFQGHFAARPEVLSAQALKANSFAMLQLLSEVQDPDISLDRLQQIISEDVALSYKLLKYINSAFFNLPREIKSVRQALVYLGLKPLRSWVSLLVVIDSGDRPHALKQLALARARFCQSLAERLGEADSAPFFTVGLFSTLDMLLGIPMEQVLDNLPLDPTLQAALINHEGRSGELLGCAMEHEEGKWDHCITLGLSPAEVNGAYCDSLAWVDELMKLMG